MTKAAEIAKFLNLHFAERRSEYRSIAEAKARELKVGIYWLGTASNYDGLPSATIHQTDRCGKWTRKLGGVTLGHDDIWRA